MPSYIDVANGNDAAASTIQQVIDSLKGTAGKGIPTSLTSVNDAINFALAVRNNEAGASKAFVVYKADGTVLFQIDKNGVIASADGTAGASQIPTLTGVQTLTNKTLTAPHMTGVVVDSGGLTVTAGGATVTAGGLGVGAAQQSNAGINVGITAATDATNRYNVFVNQPSGASNNNIGLVAGTAPTGPVTAAFFVGGAAYFSGGTPATLAGALGIGTNAVTTATTGINGAPPAQVAGYLVWQNNGTVIKIPYYLN